MLQLTIVGNLGADAQIVTSTGKPFVSFNVADTDRWTDENGETHEKTQWVSCALNGNNEKLLPYLRKGTKVCVTGTRLQTRVFGSQKERRMVAGLSLSVNHIELVGGQVDEVPARLYSQDGVQHDVHKAFYIKLEEVAALPSPVLFNRSGDMYSVTPEGFIVRASIELPQEEQPQEEQPQEEQPQEEQPQEEQPQEEQAARRAGRKKSRPKEEQAENTEIY